MAKLWVRALVLACLTRSVQSHPTLPGCSPSDPDSAGCPSVCPTRAFIAYEPGAGLQPVCHCCSPGPRSVSATRIFSFYLEKQKLEYSCFAMLRYFLLYSKVNQPYVYIYPLPFGFLFHSDHHNALTRVPCAIQ